MERERSGMLRQASLDYSLLPSSGETITLDQSLTESFVKRK
jgi:hypothetical protein